MGKCRFNPLWLSDSKYDWVHAVPGNEWEAQCSLCRKKFKLGTMGHMALESHMKSAKHLACSGATRRQAPISQFCAANLTNTSAASSTEPTQPAAVQTTSSSSTTSSTTQPDAVTMTTKQVIKVRLERKDSSLDLNDPAVMEQMLKEVQQRLKDQGVKGDVKLSWRKQADGKVFHEEEEETKKKKKTCPMKDEI